MRKISRGMMQALQRYTPESKKEALVRAEQRWSLNQTSENRKNSDTDNQESPLAEESGKLDF